MIETITVNRWIGETLDPDSLVMRLNKPELSGFAVTSIEGLGASKSTINIDESPSFDGGFFNSTHVNSRNIVLNLNYFYSPEHQTEERSYSIPEQKAYGSLEQIRHASYHYFRSKSKVRLTFNTTTLSRVPYIDGYIESNEAKIFEENSGCTISIICPDPFFYSTLADEDSMGHGEVEEVFEFPFQSEYMKDRFGPVPGLFEFGLTKETTRRVIINYDGDVETGAIFKIKFYNDNPSNKTLTIYNTDYNETMIINPNGIFKESGHVLSKGDVVEVSTLKGNKYVRILFTDPDDGLYKAIKLGFKSFPKTNDWISIVGGKNTFAYKYEGDSGESFPDGVNINISTRIKYEGI